jgi:hypothetical protein
VRLSERLFWVGLACSALGCARSESVELGRQLFVGQKPLAAHLERDETAIPTEANRCSNCHISEALPDSELVRTQTFGAPLSAGKLKNQSRRRGGPPTRYNEDSFCRLLRTGIDPASILVQRAMPRYKINEADCRALWQYINSLP